jgi:hypothetical protein
MSMEQILDAVRSLDGVLVLAPVEGSGAPEIAWGDYFFYYAPDGRVPDNVQPYGTIVTKDYPGDTESDLDRDGRWRVNIHVGRSRFAELTGADPQDPSLRDYAETDVLLPHPVYGALCWVAVVCPGGRTMSTVLALLRAAHDDERRRVTRRAQLRAGDG